MLDFIMNNELKSLNNALYGIISCAHMISANKQQLRESKNTILILKHFQNLFFKNTQDHSLIVNPYLYIYIYIKQNNKDIKN